MNKLLSQKSFSGPVPQEISNYLSRSVCVQGVCLVFLAVKLVWQKILFLLLNFVFHSFLVNHACNNSANVVFQQPISLLLCAFNQHKWKINYLSVTHCKVWKSSNRSEKLKIYRQFIKFFHIATFYKGDAVAFHLLQLFTANSHFFVAIIWI